MLYSGTMNNFQGNEPILMRTLGSQPVLKTDNFLRWLQRKDLSPSQPRSGPLPESETWQASRLSFVEGILCSGHWGHSREDDKTPILIDTFAFRK